MNKLENGESSKAFSKYKPLRERWGWKEGGGRNQAPDQKEKYIMLKKLNDTTL